jgi:Xaa-Pro aminopeptidase
MWCNVEFSIQEMTRRLDTVRARMDAVGVDCLFITGIENFSYFVGVPISLYQHRRPWCLLIPLQAEPVVIMKGPNASSFTAELNGFVRSFRHYDFPVSEELPPKVADVINGVGARRVACELGMEMRLGIP